MRTFLVFLLVLTFLVSTAGAMAQPDTPPLPASEMETTAGETFTHLPVAELLTQTSCVYCPDAEAKLDDIFQNDGYPWYYVSLVTDKNDEASGRASELEGPTWGTPTTEFDGGDETVSGGGAERSEYTQAIENTGERDDTPVLLALSMEPVIDDPNRATLTFSATWEEDGTTLNPDLQVHIYVYIMEQTSTRYQNSHSHKWVHHGFLAFVFDDDVDLEPHVPYTQTVDWVGADHSDDYGDMSDIMYDNTMAMAAVFNNEASETDNFALVGAGAIPPVIELMAPEEGSIHFGDVEISATAMANHTTMDTVQYRIDGADWVDLAMEDENQYSINWDSSEEENGVHSIDVRAVDATGTVSMTNLSVSLDNDEQPPELNWVAPDLEETLTGTVSIEVEATDPQGIEAMELQIDDRTFKAMEYVSDESYSFNWDTTTVSNGEHTLTVRAEDGIGNEVIQTWDLEIYNEGDVTRPAIDLLLPIAEEMPLRGMVEIVVKATDPGGTVESVVYTFQGATTPIELDPKPEEENQWHGYWNTAAAPSGKDVLLNITAFNDREHSTSEIVSFDIDNAPPMLGVELPFATTYHEVWASQTIIITATDHQGPVTVGYQFDSHGWIPLTSLTNTYTFEWDTTTVEDGFYRLTVQVLDLAGNEVQWSQEYRVLNTELADFELAISEPPAADEEAELTILVGHEVTGVTLVITNPINARVDAEAMSAGVWMAIFPTFEEFEGAEVVYHILLETDHGAVSTESQTFTVQPATKTPGSGNGGGSDEEDRTLIFVGLVAMAMVTVGGGAFFWHSRRESINDDWGALPQPVTSGQDNLNPTGPAAGMTPALLPIMASDPGPGGLTAPSPLAAPVTCPHCQMQLMPPPGPRPLLIGCPNCSGQMQIN